jgi:hypothetical protein
MPEPGCQVVLFGQGLLGAIARMALCFTDHALYCGRLPWEGVLSLTGASVRAIQAPSVALAERNDLVKCEPGMRALGRLAIKSAAVVLLVGLTVWFPPGAGPDYYDWAVVEGMPEWYVQRLLGPANFAGPPTGEGRVKVWWADYGQLHVCFRRDGRVQWARREPPRFVTK